MSILTFLKRLRGPSAPAERAAAGGLPPAERFRAVVERERMRADRAGSRFSLLLLTPRGGEDLSRHAARLAEILALRLRATDESGWWDEKSAGVLLPDTPAEGGRKLAHDLQALAAQDSIRIDCTLCVYPSHPAPRGDDGSIGPGGPPPATPRRERARAGQGPDYLQPAQPMELLLARRLPRWKRCMDVLGATVGLALLSPLMLAVAAAIKLTSRGPVLFRQWRDGLGGRPFVMYKFRTMYADAEQHKRELLPYSEQDGPAFKLADDPRVTWLGRYLRRTCIDELPQLWNVLRGEMSLVGPRPMDSRESARCQAWQRRRLDVTPGMTCVWQVCRGPRVPFSEWMRMDLRYLGARTFWHDARLIAKTLWAVIRHDASR